MQHAMLWQKLCNVQCRIEQQQGGKAWLATVLFLLLVLLQTPNQLSAANPCTAAALAALL